jgi:hypothetical protein
MPYKDPEVQKEYDKKKYQRNRERLLELRRIRHEKNKQAENAYMTEYQKEHRQECSIRQRNWKHRNYTDKEKQHNLEMARKWRKANPKKVIATVTRYQKKHPWKAIAHAAVSMAISVGVLIRPDSCSACGKICKPHGHHRDYSKILEVIWLCPLCHKKEHLSVS